VNGDGKLPCFYPKDRGRKGREEAGVVCEVGHAESGGHDDELERTQGEGSLEGGREGGREERVNLNLSVMLLISSPPSLPPSLPTLALASSSKARYFFSSSRAISFLSGKALERKKKKSGGRWCMIRNKFETYFKHNKGLVSSLIPPSLPPSLPTYLPTYLDKKQPQKDVCVQFLS
jgi:hypothetical protein